MYRFKGKSKSPTLWKYAASLWVALTFAFSNTSISEELKPADKFDLSEWKITLPTDNDENGKVDEVSVKTLTEMK
ncbi:hypothetical protein [Alteromonas mediterranea]|uniref:hypothetical protein n=1 Tax=Alteromonas mediterranea TaxID=314275 RepID=UPI0004209688|nr:hypothetical protein [Alteromonas mediterranea]